MGDIAGEAKLRLLREADPGHEWNSLDQTLRCVLCEKLISGRKIRIGWRRGKARLNCPTPGCRSTPPQWVHPGDPLVSEDAWRDWERLFGDR